jgi:hypothetical protein
VAKPRGRVIDDDVIEVVIYILNNWTGKLSWEALIDAIKASIATQYTRQALSKHERIATAFSLRKRAIVGEGRPRSSGDARVDALEATISELKAENNRLNAEVDRFRAQFIRWTHNAQSKFTFEELDAPLPPTNRGKTVE